jgi:hypothetical protein
VNTTFTRIREAVDVFTAPHEELSTPGAGPSVAPFAGQLGKLLPGVEGPDARRPSRPPDAHVGTKIAEGAEDAGAAAGHERAAVETSQDDGRAPETFGPGPRTGSRAGRARIRIEGDVGLGLFDGEPTMSVPFSVVAAAGAEGTRLRATLQVVLESGDTEREPPAGTVAPQVLGWEVPAGEQLTRDEFGFVPSDVRETCVLRATIPRDAEVSVELRAVAEER